LCLVLTCTLYCTCTNLCWYALNTIIVAKGVFESSFTWISKSHVDPFIPEHDIVKHFVVEALFVQIYPGLASPLYRDLKHFLSLLFGPWLSLFWLWLANLPRYVKIGRFFTCPMINGLSCSGWCQYRGVCSYKR
jgi:hypothetical protein